MSNRWKRGSKDTQGFVVQRDPDTEQSWRWRQSRAEAVWSCSGCPWSVPWLSCVLRVWSLLFLPKSELFTSTQGENAFLRVLREGSTISEMSSTPSFHCTQTAAPFQGRFHLVLVFSVLQLHLPEHLLVLQVCWELSKPNLRAQRSSSRVLLFVQRINNEVAPGNWVTRQNSLVQKVSSGSSNIPHDLSAQHW